jgi:hypothetical protein
VAPAGSEPPLAWGAVRELPVEEVAGETEEVAQIIAELEEEAAAASAAEEVVAAAVPPLAEEEVVVAVGRRELRLPVQAWMSVAQPEDPEGREALGSVVATEAGAVVEMEPF